MTFLPHGFQGHTDVARRSFSIIDDVVAAIIFVSVDTDRPIIESARIAPAVLVPVKLVQRSGFRAMRAAELIRSAWCVAIRLLPAVGLKNRRRPADNDILSSFGHPVDYRRRRGILNILLPFPSNAAKPQ